MCGCIFPLYFTWKKIISYFLSTTYSQNTELGPGEMAQLCMPWRPLCWWSNADRIKGIHKPCMSANVNGAYSKSYAIDGAPLMAQWAKESACNIGEAGNVGLIPGLGRSPGGGYGNPLQYSHLENPMDRGAWWATVHRVAKSQTRLKRQSTQKRDESDRVRKKNWDKAHHLFCQNGISLCYLRSGVRAQPRVFMPSPWDRAHGRKNSINSNEKHSK